MKHLALTLLLISLSVISFAQPTNNDCFTAIPLSYTGSCNYVTYDNTGATYSGDATAGCGDAPTKDMWFSIVIPASGNLVLDSRYINIRGAMALYTGTCGALTEYACDDNSSSSYLMPHLEIYDPSIAGETLYLQYWGNSAAEGTFDLCVFEPTQPQNLVCDSAISLNIQSTCNFLYFDSKYADNSGVPYPSCGSYVTHDVWFNTTVPNSGKLIIQTAAGTMNDPAIQVYTGDCQNLQTYACDNNSSPNYLQAYVEINDISLANQVIYIRVWRVNSIYGGTFGICAQEPPPIENDDCLNATFQVVENECSYVTYSNAYHNTSGDASPTCDNYVGGDGWIKTVVPSSGDLVISTKDISNGNLGISIYTDGCSNLTLHECQAGNGPYYAMPEVVIHDSSLAGDSLYIMTWKSGSSYGGDYQLCIFEPEIPTYIDCENAKEVSVQPSCNYQTYTNQYAMTSGDGLPTCGYYAGTDIWLKFVAPSNGEFTVDSRPGSLGDIDFSLYTGSCGSLTEYGCATNGSGTGAYMPKLTISDPALANQTMYLQIWRNGNVNGGTFDICVYGNLIPEVSQAIDQSICQGETIPTLSVENGPFQYNWYDQATGGNLLAGDTNQYQPTTAGTFYVDATNPSTLQTSGRTAITLTISNKPILVGGIDQAFCSNETAFPLSVSDLGATYNWYSDSLNGLILAIDTNQYLPSQSGTFYVVAIDSSAGCSSALQAINFEILNSPLLVNPQGYKGCNDLSYQGISVNDLGDEYNWFNDSTGGIQLAFDTNIYFPTSNGTYYVQATDINSGCQTERYPVEFELFQTSSPIIAFDGDSLHTISGYNTYQWYRNEIAIFQANQTSVDVDLNGDYYVIVTDSNGCITSSDTIQLNSMGIVKNNEISDFSIYPNPVENITHIQLEKSHINSELILYTINGQIISKTKIRSTNMEFSFREFPSGVYFISVADGEKILTKKLIKK